MIHLNNYGWNDKLNQLKQESTYNALTHGRISIVHRTCYEVVSENGLFQCELTGNMMYGKSDFELPCTGDWVLFQPFDEHKGIIVDMLLRERTLYRKKNGTVADKQAIASYVDKAFIVQSLDDNPVLVFNKADLGFDKQKVEEQIRHIARQIPVFFTSIHQPQTILQLRESISAGETVVFVGSSGVGKSSLVNALCEKSVLLTSDTPGVREFGLAIDDPDSLAEVLEISDYAASCHFKDCKHINEPGCAVLEAVSSGVLDRKVYESYLKLRREAWHFSTSEYEKRKRDKSFSKLVDEVKKRKANR